MGVINASGSVNTSDSVTHCIPSGFTERCFHPQQPWLDVLVYQTINKASRGPSVCPLTAASVAVSVCKLCLPGQTTTNLSWLLADWGFKWTWLWSLLPDGSLSQTLSHPEIQTEPRTSWCRCHPAYTLQENKVSLWILICKLQRNVSFRCLDSYFFSLM